VLLIHSGSDFYVSSPRVRLNYRRVLLVPRQYRYHSETCTAKYKGFVSAVVSARIGEFVRRAVPVFVRRSHDSRAWQAAAAAIKEATSAPDTVFEDLTAKQGIGNFTGTTRSASSLAPILWIISLEIA